MLAAYLVAKYEWQYGDGSSEDLQLVSEKLAWAVSHRVTEKTWYAGKGRDSHGDYWVTALFGGQTGAPEWGQDGTSKDWGSIMWGDNEGENRVCTNYGFKPDGKGISTDATYGFWWMDDINGGNAAPLVEYWDNWLRGGTDFTFETIGTTGSLELAESILVAIKNFSKYINDGTLESGEIPSARGFSVNTAVLTGLRAMLPFWNTYIIIGTSNQMDRVHTDTDG
jgi:hypothetical protein